MPTGAAIVKSALRRVGIIDPSEAPSPEVEANALSIATALLDSWRTERLTISGELRSVYSLAANTQSYTIGSGGTFNQEYPNAISAWSVIPDDDAAHPVELPQGRPLTSRQWQAIGVKTLTGAYPRKMWFDRSYAAGLGNCLFWPIPTDGDVDVVLYQSVPAIVSLVSGTTYTFRPGGERALKLALAIEYAEEWGRPIPDGLEQRAKEAKGLYKRANIVPKETSVRRDFIIGAGRRTLNIYTDQ